MRISDWSSDVCSSDLTLPPAHLRLRHSPLRHGRGLCLHLDRDGGLSRQHPGDLRPEGPRPPAGGVALAHAGPAHRRRRDADLEGLQEPPAPCPARRRSEEHTSELQSLMRISYAVFCLKKKKRQISTSRPTTQ